MNRVQKPQSDMDTSHLALASISRRMTKLADTLERRSAIFLPVLLVLYVWILKSSRIKRLWHDELYTFYIAQAPSFGKMMEWTRTIDLNPPLYYIAARLTFHVLHPSALSVRLPSMVAYFCRDFVCVSVCSSQAHSALWPARRHGDAGQLLQSVFL